MKILAIETSCDETAISLIETENGGAFTLLAHEVSSQIDMHREWGGVVPMLAKREHLKNLPEILERIMNSESRIKNEPSDHNSQFMLHNPSPIDLIAVTYGPGLEPALWTGLQFAKDLATKLNIPIVATDHMHGHMMSATMTSQDGKEYNLKSVAHPAMALLISGAHTELVLMKSASEFEILGHTVDDAVGEAFDKVARMLGLPYPGGPEISKLAAKFTSSSDQTQGKLPRPMLHSKDYNFSFSGLKTAVLYLIRNLREENKKDGLVDEKGEGMLSDEQKIVIAHEFEQAVTEVLIKKTTRAITEYGVKSLLVGGGVIANKTIRESLSHQVTKLDVRLFLPDNKFTGDNATMIGIAGYLRSNGGTTNLLMPGTKEFEELRATGNLSLYK